MICDAVEAASRTLIEPTPAKIRAMIQTIVDDCLRDGQFDDCDLTMRDLAVIVDTLERTVSTDLPPPHRLSGLRVQPRSAAPTADDRRWPGAGAARLRAAPGVRRAARECAGRLRGGAASSAAGSGAPLPARRAPPALERGRARHAESRPRRGVRPLLRRPADADAQPALPAHGPLDRRPRVSLRRARRARFSATS